MCKVALVLASIAAHDPVWTRHDSVVVVGELDFTAICIKFRILCFIGLDFLVVTADFQLHIFVYGITMLALNPFQFLLKLRIDRDEHFIFRLLFLKFACTRSELCLDNFHL